MKLSKQTLIALGITTVGLTGYAETEIPQGETVKTETVRDITLTRAQLDKVLTEIAKKPAAKTTTYNAMCYMMSDLPERMEYLCPVCSSKTLYEKKNVSLASHGEYNSYLIDHIKKLGVDASLDATDLCSQCRKNKTTTKADFYIEVRMGDRLTRTLLKPDDLTKIIAFLEKKDTWETSKKLFETTVKPLKPELPRIRQILGLDTPEEKQNTKRTLF